MKTIVPCQSSRHPFLLGLSLAQFRRVVYWADAIRLQAIGVAAAKCVIVVPARGPSCRLNREESTQGLRSATLLSRFFLVCACTLCGVFAGHTESEPMNLVVLKTEKELFVRSAFSPDYDVVISLRKGTNGQIDFQRVGLVKTNAPMTAETCRAMDLIHTCPDDGTPWNLNATYIGANHGWFGIYELTAPAHGLSASDFGSAWSDQKGGRFYLIKIVDADRIWMMPENRGSLESWKFSMEPPDPLLTQDGGGKKIQAEKIGKTQLLPSCRIKSQDYLIDGKTPLNEGEVVTCKTLDVAEEYDIINPAVVFEEVKAHPGREINFVDPGLDVILTNKILYQLQPWGACTIRHESTAHRSFDLGYMGFVQARVMVRQPEDTLRYYIPDTLPFQRNETRFDFRSIQDFSSPPTVPLNFSAASGNVEFPDRLPHRFIQLLERRTGGENRFAAGFVTGYSLLEGVTVPAIRAARCAGALTIHTSAKTYPVAMDNKMGKIPAGAVFNCLAYRQYFSPSAFSSNATALYWHKQGDAYVLYVDYHKTVDKDIIKLPASLAGKQISVIESTPSAKLLSGESVPNSGLVLSVTSDYGYMILALKDAPRTPPPNGSK